MRNEEIYYFVSLYTTYKTLNENTIIIRKAPINKTYEYMISIGDIYVNLFSLYRDSKIEYISPIKFNEVWLVPNCMEYKSGHITANYFNLNNKTYMSDSMNIDINWFMPLDLFQRMPWTIKLNNKE